MSKIKEAYDMYRARGGLASEEIFHTRITIWVWVFSTEEEIGPREDKGIIRLSGMLDRLGDSYLKSPQKYDSFEVGITRALMNNA